MVLIPQNAYIVLNATMQALAASTTGLCSADATPWNPSGDGRNAVMTAETTPVTATRIHASTHPLDRREKCAVAVKSPVHKTAHSKVSKSPRFHPLDDLGRGAAAYAAHARRSRAS
jgi:hypothetical protein